MTISINKLNIGTKLALIFGVILLSFVGFGTFAINRMDAVNATGTEMEKDWLPSVEQLGAIKTLAQQYRILESSHILNTAEAGFAPIEARMQDTKSTMAETLKNYEKLLSSDGEKTLFNDFSKQWNNYIAASWTC